MGRIKGRIKTIRGKWHGDLDSKIRENYDNLNSKIRESHDNLELKMRKYHDDLESKMKKHHDNLDLKIKLINRSMLMLKSVISYCQNQFVGEAVKDSEMYEYISEVRALTKIYDIMTPGVEKVRVGNDKDGGYVMARPYSRRKIGYSFGINNDVSWDSQMADEGYQIYQYDHTIAKLPQQNRAFHWKKLGLTGEDETDFLKTLKTLIKENGHENEFGMVLKMDIEHFEWDVFANIDVNTLEQFDQIVVEFHGLLSVDRVDKYLRVFRKLAESFVAIHIHGNNFGSVYFCGDLLMPQTLELTFVKKGLFEITPSTTTFPTFLDRPNDSNNNGYDIILGRW